MKLTLTAREEAEILRRRRSKANKRAIGKRVTHENAKPDRGRVRDNPYLAYLRRQPCEACGSTHRVEAAHIRAGYADAGWTPTGMQVKPSDFRALSLCAGCHRDGPNAQHRMNERVFWAKHDIYPPTRCAEVYADYQSGRDQPSLAGWPDDRPVWTGSCPCGPFSVAGKKLGFADPRHLWPAWLPLIGECRPDVLFGEQSDDADAWIDLISTDLEDHSYAIGTPDIPAAGFRGAHIRQRFYWVADTDNAEWWSERAPWHDGHWPKTGRVKGDGHAGNGGAGLGLGDAGGHGSHPLTRDAGEVRRIQEAQRQSEHGPALLGRPGAAFWLGDAYSAGLSDAELGIIRRQGRWTEGRSAQQPGDPSRPGLDWLLCRDGAWRPVEPGTCPLVDEAPARMGRLRLYGDAIDAEAAANFIGAYLDCAPQSQAA